MIVTTHSAVETKRLAEKIALSLHGGEVICLYGELGAGKTTFTKGLATALGVTDEIISPTFTLMNVYSIKTLKHKNIKTVIHVDTYRLKDEKELLKIGVEDYLGEVGTVSVVEWPEKIERLLQGKKVIKIVFEHLKDGGKKISIEMTKSE